MQNYVETPARVALKDILYLTDFSVAAEAALPFAKGIAHQNGAKLHVLHILAPDPYAATMPQLAAEVAAGQREYARAQMRKIDSQLSEVAHDVRLLEDHAFWPGLQHDLEKQHVDLIIVGTHGRQGVRKMLLGSAAEQVFRSATVPVMTIGPGVPESRNHDEPFASILFATDFAPSSLGGALYAFSLAEQCRSRLILLHVIRRLRKEELLGELSVADGIHQLNSMVPADVKLLHRPQPVVAYGQPCEKILEVAEENGVDLIVLGVRQSPRAAVTGHLMDTTAHNVVSRASCPVLTVRV